MLYTYHIFLMPLGVLFSKEIKVSLARYMVAGEREERGRREGGERKVSKRAM